MATYARVENGIAVELIHTGDYAITQLYAPVFVASMVQVPDGMTVEIGAPIGEVIQKIEPPRSVKISAVAQVSVVEDEEPVAEERTWRQSSLSATEWLVSRHRDEQELGRGTTLSAAHYLELLEYRQALRDWPDSGGFPTSVSRPPTPQWLPGVIG